MTQTIVNDPVGLRVFGFAGFDCRLPKPEPRPQSLACPSRPGPSHALSRPPAHAVVSRRDRPCPKPWWGAT